VSYVPEKLKKFFQKYTKLIGTCLTVIYLIYLYLGKTEMSFTFLYPAAPPTGLQVFFVGFLTFILCMTVSIALGHGIARVFLWVSKKRYGSEYQYITESHEPDLSENLKRDFRGFFPAIVIVEISFFLAPYSLFILTEEFRTTMGATMNEVWAWAGIFPFVSCIVVGLFVAGWILDDVGIVYRKNRKYKSIQFKEVKILGESLLSYLKGLASILLVVTYPYHLYTWLTSPDISSQRTFFEVLIMGSLIPLALIFGFMPCLYIIDKLKIRSKNYIHKYAKKIGLTEVKELGFQS